MIDVTGIIAIFGKILSTEYDSDFEIESIRDGFESALGVG